MMNLDSIRRIHKRLPKLSFKAFMEQPAFLGYSGIVLTATALISWSFAAPLTLSLIHI